MAGLDPAIFASTVLREMAGSSPAMTRCGGRTAQDAKGGRLYLSSQIVARSWLT
jgi:hypothetical protein